jgi:hypothetical protein
MRELKRGVAMALAFAVGACDNHVTQPTNQVIADVSGTWSYTASNLTGPVSFTCNIVGATMSLSQSGNIVTGSVSGGTLTCSGPTVSTNDPLPNGPIASGSVNGTTVLINFGKVNIQNVGTVSGKSIFGQVALTGLHGSMDKLLGNFSAVRQ